MIINKKWPHSNNFGAFVWYILYISEANKTNTFVGLLINELCFMFGEMMSGISR